MRSDDNPTRVGGWYWVKLGDKPWEPAHYHPSGIWSRCRSVMNYYDADFDEIGARLDNHEKSKTNCPES